jgi:soluble cytochrome b562
MTAKRIDPVRRGVLFFGFAYLFLAFIPGSGFAQEDLLHSLPAFDDLANPVLTSKSEWEKAILRYDSLAIRLAAQLSATKKETEADREAGKAVALAQSLAFRFLDFSLQLPDHERRELVFDRAGIILNLPAQLDADIKKIIAGIARRSYKKVAVEWRDRTGLPEPLGYIFLKIFASPDKMNSRYGLEATTMGVAFPCRYIAAALRFDQTNRLVRQELENTLAHEIVHLFCYTVLGFSRIERLPLWFHEGVAMELSGQTQVHHVVQDATGTFILTLTSPEDYLKYHRVFRFLKEKFGRVMLGAFISRALITAELSGVEEKSLLLQSEGWFRAKRNLEWLILLLTLAASLLVYRMARWKGTLLSMAVILTGLFALSLSTYYAHSRLRYGIGFLIISVILYLAYFSLRVSFRAARFLGEAERFEGTGDDVRALLALKSYLRVERDDPFQKWIDRGKVEKTKAKLVDVEQRVFRKCMSEAARYEERLDFQRAIERYQMIIDTITGLSGEMEEARQNLERVKAIGQLFSLLSQESDKRPLS